MKLLNLFLGLSLSIYSAAFCQVQTVEQYYRNKAFDGTTLVDTTKATPEQMTRIHAIQHAKIMAGDHYYFAEPAVAAVGVRFINDPDAKSEIYEGFSPRERNPLSSILIDGDCAVEFAALDITDKNAGDYRYHVIQNDNKEIVTWTQPSVFRFAAGHKLKYAWLGKFNYLPQQLLRIEIINIKNFKIQDAVLVDWRKVEAARFRSYVQYLSRTWKIADNGLLTKDLDRPEQTTEQYYKEINNRLVLLKRPVSVKDFIETKSLDDLRFRADDSVQNMRFQIINGNRIYKYKISLKREISGQTDSISLGEINDIYNLNKEFWKQPGKYKITFTPKTHKHGGQPVKIYRNLATSISFTVLPALNQSHSINIKTFLLIILIILTTGAYMFVQYRTGQKKKLATEAQNRQIATLQLQSVRSQLNPHFMFNALAGIQNLINKNEIGLANKYLARFARLTRNVLDDGNKELTSIEHETDLLKDYLEMEQMRFGFQYQIDIDDIDQQIEIPAMLLQPFAENAVKHGVSTLKEKGQIKVAIIKAEADLIITIGDNGKGFSHGTPHGLGTKLCEERIALLNRIYKNTTILLQTDTGANGTTVTIQLKNWL
ncbi:MAG: sensor histidine kinase [Mucilaginibacter sp.]